MKSLSSPAFIEALHPYAGPNGTLDVVGQNGLPFPVRRSFRIAAVPPGAERAGHAHRTCSQILWAVAGAWQAKVETRPGSTILTFHLKAGGAAVLVPPGNWLSLSCDEIDDVLVVLCDEPYREDSYCRDRAIWEADHARLRDTLARACAGPITDVEVAKACKGRVVVLLMDVAGKRAGERFVVDSAGFGKYPGPIFHLHRVGSATTRDWVEVSTEFFRLEDADEK